VDEHRLVSSVVVIGPPSIPHQLVRLLVDEAGATEITDHAERADVIVLVDPDPEHWTEAASAQRPVVLVTSESLDLDAVAAAVLRGADAVLSADSDVGSLRTAIELVVQGDLALSADQLRHALTNARHALAAMEGARVPVQLSRRELEILVSIARGESVKQTAISLGIRPKTVENVQSRLFRKLGARNRAQAVRSAYDLGLITE
jgi:DNA-binding NarL/FixJ family response regulator